MLYKFLISGIISSLVFATVEKRARVGVQKIAGVKIRVRIFLSSVETLASSYLPARRSLQ